MYHFIIQHKLREAFRQINSGDYARVLTQFAPHHQHLMLGQHALCGERRTLASTRRWYHRLARLLPELRFELGDIAVSGWPWRTTATVTWTDRFRLPDGSWGSNQGVHEFELRWGRVHRLVIHCDTARLQGYLEQLASQGLAEAAAAPITDLPSPAA